MKRYHATNFYRRFSRDEINGTITASAQLENCGITHPTENRHYTINESKNATLLVDWLKVIENSENTKYFSSDVSYELANVE